MNQALYAHMNNKRKKKQKKKNQKKKNQKYPSKMGKKLIYSQANKN
jgi:hypothetical protein